MHFSQKLKSALKFHRHDDVFLSAEARGRSTDIQDTKGRQHSSRRSISRGIRSLLGIVSEASDAFPPLKSTLVGLLAILKIYQRYTGNRKKMLRMIERLEAFQPMKLINAEEKHDVERSNKLHRTLDQIMVKLQQMLDQNEITRLLNNEYDDHKLAGFLDDIWEALTDYQVSLQQDIQRMGRETMNKVDLGLLSQLPRAKDAGYSSENHAKCLRGTRETVLQLIEEWAIDIESKQVYWLNGIAGSGKSTVTQSFAEFCLADGKLGASFFCSRDFIDRSNIHMIFPTLAFDLACRYPEFRAALIPVIMANPNVGHESLSVQLQKLLIGPLKSTGLSTIIIVDALDECQDDEPASVILSLLARHVDEIPAVKFFITGRPEPHIRAGFRIPLLLAHTETLLLHEVERTSVDHDIVVYLKTRLSALVTNRSDVDLLEGWPHESQIAVLVKKSAGLFIFASTTYKFVASQHGDPRDLLQLIVGMSESTSYEGTSGIDPLYTRILAENYPLTGLKSCTIHRRLHMILGAVVTIFNPLSRAGLAPLLGLSSGDIYTSLRHLHSLVRVPEDEDDPIGIFHKSFPDYLIDRGRCTNRTFSIDLSAQHAQFAIHCLEFMKKDLLQNLCGLPQYVLNRDIADLAFRRKGCISATLEYTCRFWARHLLLAGGEVEPTLLPLLEFFVEHRLLAWLEVLSIGGDLGIAVHAINGAKTWIRKIKGSNEGLLTSLNDAERFILRCFDIIEQSAPHVYDSALLWAPVKSLVRMRYQTQSKMQGKLLNPQGVSWDACLRTIAAGSNVKSVTFSHNGALIAVFGVDGEHENVGFLRLFEAATGLCLARLEVEAEVGCVSFSSDDMFLAAGSLDSEVTVWDIKTGSLFSTLGGSSAPAVSVAFSSEGKVAKAAASDGSVRMWDILSGQYVSVTQGPSKTPVSVCWSPTDSELASGTADGRIFVWDALTGDVRLMLEQHTTDIHSLTYTPDGSRIISCDHSAINVCDATTGSLLHTLTSDKALYSVASSPDGDRIALGGENLLQVWDPLKGVVTNFKSEPVSSVSFAPDGTSIAAGGYTRFFRVWNAAGAEHVGLVDHHTSRVQCFAFATDGNLMVSGSEDCSVKLWDMTTGLCMRTFAGHSDSAMLVALSLDNSLVASVSSDGSIQIWDCNTGALLRSTGLCWDSFELSFSSDGEQLVIVSNSGTTTFWNVETGEKVVNTRLQISSSENEDIPVPTIRMEISFDPAHIVTETPLAFCDPFTYSQEEGWVLDHRDRPICWIPMGLRTDVFKWHGGLLALGVASGRVVLFDFSEVS